jgi:hypothetical protein
VSTSQTNLAVAVGITENFPDPTAQWGNTATTVQIQNTSAFIISVIAGGETFTIQPFVAQTVPLGSSQGAGITIEGIASPSGLTTDALTLVWLLPKEEPPMQDGPLTSAALIAATLPPGQVFHNIAGAKSFVVTVPSNARTLILVIVGSFFEPVVGITNITIQGEQTDQLYYNQTPYLFGAQSISAQVICPVNGAADTTYGITVTSPGPASGPWAYSVYADTAQYKESTFYNGTVKVANAFAASGTMVTGPCRLLGLTATLVPANAACNAVVSVNGQQLIVLDQAGATGTVAQFQEVTFPDDTILQQGQTVTFSTTGGFGSASVAYAYP